MERILYAGDSTVAFNKINTYPQTGMSQALPLYLKDNIQVISFAKNGRSTRSFIAEGRLAAIEKELKKGDYLFVQFGHNDSKADEARHTDPDTDFKENLRMFAETAKACGAKAVFITPIARRLFDENGTFKPGSHGAYPRAMKEAAKEAGVPVVGVWCQDWSGCRRTGFGYQVMWNWEWDQELYPGLDKKIAEWKEEGVRFLGYINPFIAIEKDLYAYASEHGYCVQDREGKDYLVTITTFPAAMVDFTNPEAYEWYKGLIKENMIGLGMGGWMADFGEYLPIDAVLYSGEDPAIIHNQWPAIWAKMNQEAVAECGKEGQVFFFTRAGHTGTIAHSHMMWTGDQHVDWSIDDGLPAVIPATLSLAMSGYGIAHSDVGGYTTIMHMRRSKELLLRWEEMNVFSPLFRTHEGNQPVNNVQFDDDEELLAQLAKCGRMHVALKDYLKGLVAEEISDGTPVMRPLFYHYDEAEAYTEKTEYLLGRDLLVAPVYEEGAKSRTIYLPSDGWVNIFDGKEYAGGHMIVEAPIGKPPVFVRKDSKDYEALMQVAQA